MPSEDQEQVSQAEAVDQPVEQKEEEWQTRYYYLKAEFDNYRKRMQHSQVTYAQNICKAVWEDLLPIADDFERATAMDQAEQSLHEGVVLIHQKLKTLLKKQGVVPMEVKEGDTFDAEKQEAIAKIAQQTAVQEGKILEVARQGYLYEGKVLRAAQVIVATS